MVNFCGHVLERFSQGDRRRGFVRFEMLVCCLSFGCVHVQRKSNKVGKRVCTCLGMIRAPSCTLVNTTGLEITTTVDFCVLWKEDKRNLGRYGGHNDSFHHLPVCRGLHPIYI